MQLRLTQNRVRYAVAKTPLRAAVVWARHHLLRPSDVFLGAYPRSGSTWLKFMLFEILSGEEADFLSADDAIPHVGSHFKAQQLLRGGGRLIKTHEPARPEYRRAIYMVRDVRSVALSEFAFWRWRGIEFDSFDEFLSLFLAGRTHGYGFGSWVDHVASWLDLRDQDGSQVRIIRYEDLRRDTTEALISLLEFLEESVDRSAIENAVRNNSLDRMREKEDRFRETSRGRRPIFDRNLRFVRRGAMSGQFAELEDRHQAQILWHAGKTLKRLRYDEGGG
jgi:LPS sulfotransferase NodH